MSALNKKWKTKRRFSFQFYFTIFVSFIVVGSVSTSVWLSGLVDNWLEETFRLPRFISLVLLSLVIGGILSYFVGKFTLTPIKNIRDAMNKVAEGDLNVSVEEESRFDEVEDICHAFNLMMKELRSTETIQTDFISNVSHEFKTPLTAIEGYTTLLQDQNLTDEERLEYTDKILLHTHRMSELVGNILLLSKLDNQGIESLKTNFSIDEQIRQSIVLFEAKWTEKNVELDVELETIEYFGNENMMTHVWNNLIGNAIKFSPDNGKIEIVLKRWNGYIYFSIADEGEGIREDVKRHIFDKFYQADTSHKQEGNGLGLALVKKILDINAGEIEVENLELQGCKFIVRLPDAGE